MTKICLRYFQGEAIEKTLAVQEASDLSAPSKR
jgi:hypothetical protein